MNIEEIKKKLNDLAYWGDISPNQIEKDVEYLLSIIEQAEKDFEQIHHYLDAEAYTKAWKETTRALQAIRGDK